MVDERGQRPKMVSARVSIHVANQRIAMARRDGDSICCPYLLAAISVGFSNDERPNYHVPLNLEGQSVMTDQNEMVERVARAMRAREWDGDYWNEADMSDKEYWLASARAAIEAMREPTEAMIDAVQDLSIGEQENWQKCWGIAIEAALVDQKAQA